MRKISNKIRIAGAILAGGKATRMGGIEKGNIEIETGISIIDKLLKEFAGAEINDMVIVSNNKKAYQNYGNKVIPDIRADSGPLAGIEAALLHLADNSDAVIFVPCDLPKITSNELLVLKKAFENTQDSVVFAATGFFLHPLCAAVHNDLVKTISSALDNGQRKIQNLWQKLKATPVQFPDENAFLNINKFSDMDRL